MPTGTPAAVGAAATRRHGDEERHNIACRGTIPQDLYPKARASQVSRDTDRFARLRFAAGHGYLLLLILLGLSFSHLSRMLFDLVLYIYNVVMQF